MFKRLVQFFKDLRQPMPTVDFSRIPPTTESQLPKPASKNVGHFQAFNEKFFTKYQKVLLWLLNTPVIKIWFRWILRIRRHDCPIDIRIDNLAPNCFTFNTRTIWADYLLLKNGRRVLYDRNNPKHRVLALKCRIIQGWAKVQTTDFRTHPKFGKRLYYAFKPFWWLLHFWDWALADRWVPRLSFGFLTLTTYPDPDPGTTSCDGTVGSNAAGQSWATIRAATGNVAYPAPTAYNAIQIVADSTTSNWIILLRSIYLFNTSALTASAIISAATLSLNANGVKADDLSISPNINIYTSAPASNTAVVGADYSTLGATAQCDTPITYASWTINAYNDFVLNATGQGNISKTSISKFGARNANYDVSGTTPTWSVDKASTLQVYFADQAGTANDPKLVVTYTIPVTDLSVSVSDSITVSENIALAIGVNPNVNDTVTVSENISFDIRIQPNVYDSITVSENVSFDIKVQPNVNDSISVAENVVFVTVLMVNVFDTVTISENVAFDIRVKPNVSDAITVSEFTQLQILSYESISDAVTVSESVALVVVSFINVFDAVTVNDSFAQFQVVNLISVFDTATITENVSLNITIPPSVFDTVTVTENVSFNILVSPNVSDSIAVSEFVQFKVVNFLSVSDTVTTSESIQMQIVSFISVNDAVTTSENISFLVVNTINVNDSITVSESVTIVVQVVVALTGTVTPHVNEQDIINGGKTIILTAENDTWVAVGATFDAQRQNIINGLTSNQSGPTGWNNTVKLLQSITGVVRTSATVVTITLDARLTYGISADEIITVTVPATALVGGNAIVAIPTFTVYQDYKFLVFDSVTVSENIVLTIILSVSMFDSVATSENIVLSIPLPVSVFDSVVTSENIVLSIPLPISVSDSITVTDVTNQYIPTLYISLSDSVVTSENIATFNIPLPVSVFDSITIIDVASQYIPTLYISLFDSVTTSENLSPLNVPLPISVFDSIIVTDVASEYEPILYIYPFESVTVSEYVQISYSLPYPIFDSVTVSENVVLSIPLPVFTYDSVTVTDVASEYEPILYLSPFDSVTVSENIPSPGVPLPVSVSDSITVTDVASEYEPIYYIYPIDSVTVSEYVQISYSLPYPIFDSVTVSENIAIETLIQTRLFPNLPRGSTLPTRGLILGGSAGQA